MWKTAVGAVALVIAGGAGAAPITYTQEDYAACPKLAAAARGIMSARQHNAPLVDVMGLVEMVDADYAPEARTMLRLAYGESPETTTTGRANAVSAFAKKVLDGCRKDIAEAHQGQPVR